MRIESHGNDRRKIHQHVRMQLIDLRFLNRQEIANALAIRIAFAGCMRWLAIVLTALSRAIAVSFVIAAIRFNRQRLKRCRLRVAVAGRIVRVMATTSQHCVDEQRKGHQAGDYGAHSVTIY